MQDAGVELSGLGSQDDLRFLLRFFLGGFLFLGGFGAVLLGVRVRLGAGGTVVGAAPGQDGHASPEQEQHEEQATAAKTELFAGGHCLLRRPGVARRGHLGLVHGALRSLCGGVRYRRGRSVVVRRQQHMRSPGKHLTEPLNTLTD